MKLYLQQLMALNPSFHVPKMVLNKLMHVKDIQIQSVHSKIMLIEYWQMNPTFRLMYRINFDNQDWEKNQFEWNHDLDHELNRLECMEHHVKWSIMLVKKISAHLLCPVLMDMVLSHSTNDDDNPVGFLFLPRLFGLK